MDTKDAVAEFRRTLCGFYGYDENLKYVGSKSAAGPKSDKAFLAPLDFLDFAVRDSATLEDERNRVNCLGNCKRAIDAEVESLIRRLGFLPHAKKKAWNIPKKIEFISGSGVVAPRILRKVNVLRNDLEHEFALPSKHEVEDALDIAALFVSYGELVSIPVMNWTLSGGITVRYDYDEMVFRFFEKNPDLQEGEPLQSLTYGTDQFQDFYDFLMKTVPEMERKSHTGEDV
jgi:hypothetical protein